MADFATKPKNRAAVPTCMRFGGHRIDSAKPPGEWQGLLIIRVNYETMVKQTHLHRISVDFVSYDGTAAANMPQAVWLAENGAAGQHGTIVPGPPAASGAGHAPAAVPAAANTAPSAGEAASDSFASPVTVQGGTISAHTPVTTAGVNQTPAAHGAATTAVTVAGRSDLPVSAPATCLPSSLPCPSTDRLCRAAKFSDRRMDPAGILNGRVDNWLAFRRITSA